MTTSPLTRVGLLGGMSWQSTSVYYRLLNEMVQQRQGGHASASVTLWSVDFAEIEAYQRAGDWDAQGRILADAAAGLEAAGCRAIALATNTLHLVSEQITSAISVPFVDLVEVCGQAAADQGFRTVGLLATGYTMRSALYPDRLAKFGVEVLLPTVEDQQDVHRLIYDELVLGTFADSSRTACLGMVERLADAGAQAVILGCTELGMLVGEGDARVPLLDTTSLHCEALTEIMISGARQ